MRTLYIDKTKDLAKGHILSRDDEVTSWGNHISGPRFERIEVFWFPEENDSNWNYMKSELLARLSPGGKLIIHG